MKKKFFVYVCAACLAFSLPACSDDDPAEEIDDSSIPTIESGAPDIANGNNVLMIDIDKPDEFRIKLGTKKNVVIDVNDETNFPVNLRIITEADTSRYLTIHSLKENIKPEDFIRPKVFGLTLSLKNGTESKDVKMVFRKAGVSSGTAEVYAKKIGMGTKIWDEIGNVTQTVLSFEHIADEITTNNNLEGTHFEFSGNRYEETMEKMSVAVGISGSGVASSKKHICLSGGANYSQENVTHNSKNYEVYLGYYQKNMAEAKLNIDWIKDLQQSNELYALLNTTTNNALNNPGTGAYNEYPNTREGIFRLLDNYGTNVIMQGTFGGTYIFIYSRQENAYESSIGHDASASMKFTQTSGGAAGTWLEQYQKKMGSTNISADAAGDDYSDEYRQATKAFSLVLATGGDGSTDIDTWETKFSTEDPSKWALISYLTKDSDGDGRLLDIREFVCDPDRKKAIDEYIDEYLDSKVSPMTEDRLVLADFYMKKANVDYHKDGEPKSFVGDGPDGKKYVYFPLINNGNFLYTGGNNYIYESQRGYATETNQDHFVTGTTTACHYWYYALGYDSECNGITDILFDNKSHSGYSRRGNHANDGVSGLIDNNYTYVKTGGSDTPYEDKIKAVGLYNHANKNGDKWRIWATSGGAEMKMPYDNSENIDAFEAYWEPKESKGHTSSVSGSNDFYTGGLSTPNGFRVFYQKKPLPIDNLSFGEGNSQGKILHAKKWGE